MSVRSVFIRLTAAAFAVGFLAVATPARAAIFGTVRGVVHDPQHRPVPGATVTLDARDSEWSATAVTDANGAFQFQAVPIGEYVVSAALEGFETLQQAITVISGTTPVVHFQLELASLQQTVTVSASAEGAHPESVTPTTLVSREEIRQTPGADRTNGVEAITAYVPGSYTTHDQLHVRGGHQVSWLVDGVPVPNTNIASNVGPQFDPKDVDYLEAQRGSYDAAYGDRTYGVFNVVPRTGFERDNEAELVASVGSYYQTNDQFSVGGHTERFAYYASASGNRSNLGLETPVADVRHDRESGAGGFSTLVFNVNPANQLRLVTSARHDSYQIPNTVAQQAAGVSDLENESDVFVNGSWVRTFAAGVLLTVSPFYHFNAANYEGGAADYPISATDERSSSYLGAQTTVGWDATRNHLQAGFYGFHQRDDQRFALAFNDGSAADFSTRETPTGRVTSVFAQDKLDATSWLTVSAGVRQTHFAGAVTENATSPRIGASVQVPRVAWVVRGFWGRFYQSPPLVTASGPLLGFVTASELGFIPLRGERDEEYQVGLAVPLRGWAIDADRFQTRATNFFDHNAVGNSNVFFPLTIEGALIQGWELTVRSPRTWHGQLHVAYSHQHVRGRGAISGGLTDFEPPEEGGYFPLDHDQRDTFSAGGAVDLPRGLFAAANLYYGSGFPNDDTGTYLPGHTTVDLTAGRSFGDRLSASLNVLNATDRHVLIDNSLTFGGTHFNKPREIYLEARYRFHY